ncbi:MAG: hypothetical protein WCI79_00495 [Candidatus Saccharibacteria bacterium]
MITKPKNNRLATRKHNNLSRILAHKIILSVIILALLCAAFAICEINHITNFIKSPAANNPDATAQTTSTVPSAQNDFTNGDSRTAVTQTTKQEGIVLDTQGNVISTVPQSEWSVSTDGIISAYSPTKNAILSSGSTISGESTTSIVSFRLIDNVSGVISQGNISVNNGKFSGVFEFATTATEGRLDLFSSDTNSGRESSTVEIPVRFN